MNKNRTYLDNFCLILICLQDFSLFFMISSLLNYILKGKNDNATTGHLH